MFERFEFGKKKRKPTKKQLAAQQKWFTIERYALRFFAVVMVLTMFAMSQIIDDKSVEAQWNHQFVEQTYLGSWYPVDNGMIVIKPAKSNNNYHLDALLQTSAHEIGHHVFYTRLTQQERREWAHIHNNTEAGEYVSDYAMEDAAEDFAESFETVIRFKYDSYWLKGFSGEKAAFMDRIFYDRQFMKPEVE